MKKFLLSDYRTTPRLGVLGVQVQEIVFMLWGWGDQYFHFGLVAKTTKSIVENTPTHVYPHNISMNLTCQIFLLTWTAFVTFTKKRKEKKKGGVIGPAVDVIDASF